MKIHLIGKTQGVFKVEIDTDAENQFRLYSSQDGISANTYYIDEIIEMLMKAKELIHTRGGDK